MKDEEAVASSGLILLEPMQFKLGKRPNSKIAQRFSQECGLWCSVVVATSKGTKIKVAVRAHV